MHLSLKFFNVFSTELIEIQHIQLSERNLINKQKHCRNER